jgi:integrase
MTGDLVSRPASLPADRVLSQRTRERIEQSIPENTKRAYSRWWTDFEDWCAVEGRTSLPATPETLADYVSALCDRKPGRLGASSIEQAIAVVQARHRMAGHRGEPDTDGARRVLKTHRRELADNGRRAKEAVPISVKVLQAMIEATPVEDEHGEPLTAGLRDRCALVLGFAMMARRSEVAALNISDVAFTENGLEILIRSSKTDQSAKGAVVKIPKGTRKTTNPVRVVRAWLDALERQGITEGRLLRAVDRHGKARGSISPDGVNRIVRGAAERAQLENAAKFTAHSLRAGGATAAWKGGAPVSQIAKHGRWAPDSPTVHRYIRAEDDWTDNAMNGVDL